MVPDALSPQCLRRDRLPYHMAYLFQLAKTAPNAPQSNVRILLRVHTLSISSSSKSFLSASISTFHMRSPCSQSTSCRSTPDDSPTDGLTRHLPMLNATTNARSSLLSAPRRTRSQVTPLRRSISRRLPASPHFRAIPRLPNAAATTGVLRICDVLVSVCGSPLWSLPELNVLMTFVFSSYTQRRCSGPITKCRRVAPTSRLSSTPKSS